METLERDLGSSAQPGRTPPLHSRGRLRAFALPILLGIPTAIAPLHPGDSRECLPWGDESRGTLGRAGRGTLPQGACTETLQPRGGQRGPSLRFVSAAPAAWCRDCSPDRRSRQRSRCGAAAQLCSGSENSADILTARDGCVLTFSVPSLELSPCRRGGRFEGV